MARLTVKILTAIYWLAALVWVVACKNVNRDVPFPSDEKEFATPVPKPFKLSEPRKIDWVFTNTDTLNLPLPKRIDFNKIPSKGFYPDGFHPLTFESQTLIDGFTVVL